MITLDERGGNTDFGFRGWLDSAAVRDQVATCAIPAHEQNFDRIKVELAAMSCHGFTDLDGHISELMDMNASAAPAQA